MPKFEETVLAKLTELTTGVEELRGGLKQASEERKELREEMREGFKKASEDRDEIIKVVSEAVEGLPIKIEENSKRITKLEQSRLN